MISDLIIPIDEIDFPVRYWEEGRIIIDESSRRVLYAHELTGQRLAEQINELNK